MCCRHQLTRVSIEDCMKLGIREMRGCWGISLVLRITCKSQCWLDHSSSGTRRLEEQNSTVKTGGWRLRCPCFWVRVVVLKYAKIRSEFSVVSFFYSTPYSGLTPILERLKIKDQLKKMLQNFKLFYTSIPPTRTSKAFKRC